MRPTVASGYMRDEKKVLMWSAISKNLGIELAAYIHFANSRAKYTGAELAYLQSSAMGHGVYRRLGFRDVEEYCLLTRPA